MMWIKEMLLLIVNVLLDILKKKIIVSLVSYLVPHVLLKKFVLPSNVIVQLLVYIFLHLLMKDLMTLLDVIHGHFLNN